MAWDWADTFKGLIATAIGAVATLSYKRLKPTYYLIRKYLSLVSRTEKLANDVSILQAQKVALFHTDRNPIVVKNSEGELIYCNPSFLDLTGLDNMEDALRFGFTQAIHPDDRERADRLREQQIHHPSQMYGTIKFKNIKSGSTVLTVYRTKLVHNYKGELIETIGRLYIISE